MILSNPTFKTAYEAEGLKVHWGAMRKLAGVWAEEDARYERHPSHSSIHKRKSRMVRSKL